jgi:hypothetical protein
MIWILSLGFSEYRCGFFGSQIRMILLLFLQAASEELQVFSEGVASVSRLPFAAQVVIDLCFKTVY